MTRLSIKWVVAVAAAIVCARVASAQTLTLNSSPPPGDIGTPYSQPVVSGGMAPYTWTGTPPNGLMLNADGTMSGTPSAPSGPFTFAVTVIDSSTPPLTAAGTITVQINPQLQITAPAVPPGEQNVPYASLTFTASGGSGSYSWTQTGTLPS